MADLLIRNLDEATLDHLKRVADTRGQSVEDVARAMLAVSTPVPRVEVLAADRIRRMTPKPLTDDSTDLIRAARDA